MWARLRSWQEKPSPKGLLVSQGELTKIDGYASNYGYKKSEDRSACGWDFYYFRQTMYDEICSPDLLELADLEDRSKIIHCQNSFSLV